MKDLIQSLAEFHILFFHSLTKRFVRIYMSKVYRL